MTGRKRSLTGPRSSSRTGAPTPSSLLVEAHDLTPLFEASLDLLGVVGTDGYLKRINPAWVRALGHSEQDLLSRPVLDFIHPDDLATTIAGFARANTGRTTALLRVRGRCADGTYRLFEWNSVPRAGSGLIDVVGRDITAPVAMEQALRESEERYHQVVEALHEGVVLQDASGAIIASNTNAREILGLALDEITGRTSTNPGWRAIHADGSPFPGEEHPAMVSLRTGQPCTGIVMGVRRPSGETRWITINAQPLMGPNGAPPHAVVTSFADITERTTAREVLADREAALSQADDERRRSASLLATIIDGTNDHIHAKDLEGRYLLTNRADAEWFGIPMEEIIGRSDADLIGPQDAARFVELDRAVIESGSPLSYEQEATRDGVTRTWLTTKDVIRAEGGRITGVFSISREITDQKRVEAQLRQSAKLEAIGQLAGGVAHDFNNMLTAIRGYAELVRLHLPADDDEDQADLGQVVLAADRAAALTRQLLAFSRRQVLAPQVLDPVETLAGITPMLRRLLGEHIELTSHSQPGTGRVQVDPAQLEQVIVNLAVNARDAMPDGGQLTIETSNVQLDRAYAAAHPDAAVGPHVMLAVSDTGTGMDRRTQARIFEPFFTTKPVGKGTGMGLATVYGIVTQSGGSVYVYSEPGHGTTFKILFPRVVGETAAADTGAPPRAPMSIGSETILLVEDEDAVRGFAHRTLSDLGYTVLEAPNGTEALELAAAHTGSIQLLVTDIVMPGLQGVEFAELLTAARPRLRTLFVSGFTEHSGIHHAVTRPGVDYLPKPYSGESLALAVRAILDGAPRT